MATALLSARWSAAIVFFLSLLLPASQAHPTRPRQPSGRKNVLFFAVDDLRVELGTYGHEQVKSPNIDQLAAESLVFERAYCQVAVCAPSRTSLMTSRRPDTNHAWWSEYWRPITNATSLPQYFKENGYLTIGMGKVFHPGPDNGYNDKKYAWSPEGLPYFEGTQPTIKPRNSWKPIQETQSSVCKIILSVTEPSAGCRSCTRRGIVETTDPSS